MTDTAPVFQINPTARDWKIVEAWAEARLAEDLRALEHVLTDDIKTHRLRGSIARTRALLALANPPTPKFPDAGDPLGQL